MSYRYFASRTLYQILATMETLFSVVILTFACITVVNFQNQDGTYPLQNRIILHAGVTGIVLSLVQIIGSGALIWSTRGPHSFDKDDYAISSVPTVCFFLAFINLGLLLFIFLGPLLHVDSFKGYGQSLQKSIADMFTYVVANAIFKIFYVWAMYTTIRCRRRQR